MKTRRFLLISRVGCDSLHEEWLAPAEERDFDVLISAYDRRVAPPVACPSIFFEYREGRKVAGYGEILRDHRELIAGYDYVALFDDDLLIDAGGLTRLFSTIADHKLKIAQPALDHSSFFTYGCLLRHSAFLLRYTTYVEMMCPIFRSDILLTLTPLFQLGFESGIDLIWSGLVHGGPHDFAVIDAYPVCHTRRVGTLKAANGFGAGKPYEHDIHAILDRFSAPWLPCLPYAAIRCDGRYTGSRIALVASAAPLIFAIPRHFPMKWRMRNVAVYWNHLLRRRPKNARIAWPTALTDEKRGNISTPPTII